MTDPLSKARDSICTSWILVRFISTVPQGELLSLSNSNVPHLAQPFFLFISVLERSLATICLILMKGDSVLFKIMYFLFKIIVLLLPKSMYAGREQEYLCAGSSRCGAVETNPTSNHEVAGLIPGLSVGQQSGIAVSCGVGHRHGLDPVLLWLWCRPAATAPIRLLAWEPPYAAGAALAKRQKDREKKKEKGTNAKYIVQTIFINTPMQPTAR